MREIIFSKEFDLAVEALGGYRLVDPAIEAVLDGLRLNPYGFARHENDWGSFRYAVTEAFGSMPPLIVYFTISPQTKSVELTFVEVFDNY